MKMNAQTQVDYVLGDSDGELQRLIRQSEMYAELTANFSCASGIKAGMRVLDVGCGPGCISLQLARLVGPSGAVVGVDKSPRALDLARQRAASEHLANVTFVESHLNAFESEQKFDALIGRFVLMFMPDPAAILRQLSHHVVKGGIVAFQEMDISAAKLVPNMPLRRQAIGWIVETFQQSGVDLAMGPKLYAIFLDAGLPGPSMNLQAIIGGGSDFSSHHYLTDLIWSLLPKMKKLGICIPSSEEIGTLAERLEMEMHSLNGVIVIPPLVGAWAKIP